MTGELAAFVSFYVAVAVVTAALAFYAAGETADPPLLSVFTAAAFGLLWPILLLWLFVNVLFDKLEESFRARK